MTQSAVDLDRRVNLSTVTLDEAMKVAQEALAEAEDARERLAERMACPGPDRASREHPRPSLTLIRGGRDG